MGTRNFPDYELTCPCGCGALLDDEEFLYHLQTVRSIIDIPLPLSSAKRCPEYNNRVSKTGLNGPHTRAAVDIQIAGDEVWRLIYLAMREGFNGIGINQKGPWIGRFIHLDRREKKTIWTY